MKKIAYRHNGQPAMTTMTVGELRAALAVFPDDTPVLFTWEGIHTPVEQRRITAVQNHRAFDQALIVELDADTD